MAILNIDKRTVTAELRNGRQNETGSVSSSGSIASSQGSLLAFKNGLVQSGNTVSLSGKYIGNTNYLGVFNITGATVSTVSGVTTANVSGFTGNAVNIKGDLYVDGNITASKDVIAYFASASTTTVLDALSVSQPLFKLGNNISLNYDSSQFTIDAGKLKLINSISTGTTFSGDWNSITNKPVFATVATSGSYNDLINKPDFSQYQQILFTKQGDTIYANQGLNLHVDGNITASKDVISYFASASTTTVLDALSVSQPLYKLGNNISLNYSSYYFDTDQGQLIIKPDVVATKAHTHQISGITGLQTVLDSKISSYNLTNSYLPIYNNSRLENSSIRENNAVFIDNQVYISGNTSINGNTEITGDLHVDGNITASKDVIAYFASASTSTVLDALSVSQPLFKAGNNISLNYNSSQFEILSGSTFSIKSGILTTVSWSNVTNKPNFATVATSGNYQDLINKPAITSTISGATDYSQYFNTSKKALSALAVDWSGVNNKPNFATVATSGSYTDLSNKPTIYTTIAGLTDYSTYFDASNFIKKATYASNAGYASTASVADSANAVYWSNVLNRPSLSTVASTGSYTDLINKPSTFTPAAHTIASHSDVSSYFSGTKALTASVADSANAVTWSNVTSKPSTFTPASHTIASHSDVSSYFNGTKALTAATADTASAAITSFQIKNSGGSVIWTVTLSGNDLYFNNGSNRAKLDASGNLYASGEVTAYASI